MQQWPVNYLIVAKILLSHGIREIDTEIEEDIQLPEEIDNEIWDTLVEPYRNELTFNDCVEWVEELPCMYWEINDLIKSLLKTREIVVKTRGIVTSDKVVKKYHKDLTKDKYRWNLEVSSPSGIKKYKSVFPNIHQLIAYLCNLNSDVWGIYI